MSEGTPRRWHSAMPRVRFARPSRLRLLLLEPLATLKKARPLYRSNRAQYRVLTMSAYRTAQKPSTQSSAKDA